MNEYMQPPQKQWYQASIGDLVNFLFKLTIASLIMGVLWAILWASLMAGIAIIGVGLSR